MNITKKEIDKLNAVLTVEIAKDDYAKKVDDILNNYRKNANIPGFRKGHVPMGMVKKQYGKAVLIDEVNKLLQESLHNYMPEEKLEVLGNPLPKNEMEINWDSDDFNFEFELGDMPLSVVAGVRYEETEIGTQSSNPAPVSLLWVGDNEFSPQTVAAILWKTHYCWKT